MKILNWNCRGLGNPATVRALTHTLRTENPDIVFMMETRLFTQQFVQLNQLHFKYFGCLLVDCSGNNHGKK